MNYQEFLTYKTQLGGDIGFNPHWMPEFLFDFQSSLVEWAIRKGRAAMFADCGMGKGPMALAWCENGVRETNKPFLILTPLAVAPQFVREGEKFGIEVHRSRDGDPHGNITVTNYDQLHK